MSRKLLLVLSTYIFIGVALAQSQRPVYLNQAVAWNSVKGYYEYLPADYNSSSKNYPLIIWVHGAGQGGEGNSADLPKVLEWGIPKIIKEGIFPSSFNVGGKDFSFIVISPQFTTGWPNGFLLSEMLNYIVSNYRIDPDRIYLTGMSAGGGAVWDFASMNTTNSNRIGAIVPFAGTISPTSPSQEKANIIAQGKLPVWAFHNTHDGTVSVNISRNWVNYINNYDPAVNPPARLTESPVQSNNAVIAHDSWSSVVLPSYKPNGINIYEWMLQQQRRVTVTNKPPYANAGADQGIILPSDVVLNASASNDPDGIIESYQWRKTSGPSSYNFVDANVVRPTVKNLQEGVYEFEVTVTDNLGASSNDRVIVNVSGQPVNAPPVANAGNDITISLPQNTVTLNGCSSNDPENASLVYKWTKTSGPQGTIISDTECSTSVNGLVQGSYIFNLQVTDNEGLTASDNVKITVQAQSNGNTIKVNLFGGENPYNDPQWNNWNIENSIYSSNFNYSNGSASSVSADLTSHGGLADNGQDYETSATICPPEVLRYNSYNTSNRTLTIRGLDPSKQYSIEFYASRSNNGNGTVVEINNVSDTIDTDSNNDDFAKLNVTSSPDGILSVQLSRLGTYQYLAGFIISVESSQARSEAFSITTTRPAEITDDALSNVTDELKIYPNPFSGSLRIEDNSIESKTNYTLILMDVSGKTIWKKILNNQERISETINTTGIKKGLYILQVISKNSKSIYKVVKE